MNYIELEQTLKDIGFKHFEIINDTSKFEDTTIEYIIDILPFRLKISDENFYDETLKNEIPKTSFNDIENFYFKKNNFKNLKIKWYSILIKFAYYYKLKTVYLYARSSDKYPEIQKYCDYSGVFLEFRPINIMGNLERFVDFVSSNLDAFYFIFEFENKIVFNMFPDELFLSIYFLNNVSIEEHTINILEMLVKSENLFLRTTNNELHY